MPTYVARDVHDVIGQLADLGRVITTAKFHLDIAIIRVTIHQGQAGLDLVQIAKVIQQTWTGLIQNDQFDPVQTALVSYEPEPG